MPEKTVYGARGKSRRRSTRVTQALLLKVSGTDAQGEPFEEETGTLEVGFQGCRYFSTRQLAANSYLTLEVPGALGESQRVQARVVWTCPSRWLKGMYQVGVELQAPGNVWGLETPPCDWLSESERSAAELAKEIAHLLAVAASGNHYQLLGVSGLATPAQIKTKYHQLARKYHPDLHMDHSAINDSVRQLMEKITRAYKVLSDEKARQQFDAHLATHGTAVGVRRSDEDFYERARACLRAKNYLGSILWLRKCVSAAPDAVKYRLLLARTLAAVPQYRHEAIEHFEKVTGLDPLNLEARLQLAEIFVALQLPWRARSLYQQALEIDSGNTRAQQGLQALGPREQTIGKRRPSPPAD